MSYNRINYSNRKAPSGRSKNLVIKLSPEEHFVILKKANETGLTVSEYILFNVLEGEEVKRELPKSKAVTRSIPPIKKSPH